MKKTQATRVTSQQEIGAEGFWFMTPQKTHKIHDKHEEIQIWKKIPSFSHDFKSNMMFTLEVSKYVGPWEGSPWWDSGQKRPTFVGYIEKTPWDFPRYPCR